MMKLLAPPLSCSRVMLWLLITAVVAVATLAAGLSIYSLFFGRTVDPFSAMGIFTFSLNILPFIGFMLVFRYSRWFAARTELVRWLTSAVLSLVVTGIFATAVTIALWFTG